MFENMKFFVGDRNIVRYVKHKNFKIDMQVIFNRMSTSFSISENRLVQLVPWFFVEVHHILFRKRTEYNV